MPFQKGRSKTGGIKKGQVQEKTKAWERLGELITGKFTEDVIAYVDKLPGDEKLDAYLKLLDYFKPKLQRSDNTTEHSFKGSGLKIGFDDDNDAGKA
jgi:hypothetical protein